MKNNYSAIQGLLSEKGISFLSDEPLCVHSTFRIGGPASLFITPTDRTQLADALSVILDNNLSYFVLGRGSNVLFDDSGFRGAVISTAKLDGIQINEEVAFAECGASFTRLSSAAADRGLSGLEFAYGIPGSVGGAVYMNAGAYGGEVSDVLVKSEYLYLSTLEIKTLDAAEHEFGYRMSAFKNGGMLHLSSEFRLKRGDKAKILATMNDFMQRRKDKQPLEYPSAGSTFKRYPGRYTGQMIEEAGLKGLSVGGAQVSEKHAGFIINKENASASDVLQLIDVVKSRISESFGVEIECEVIHVKNNG